MNDFFATASSSLSAGEVAVLFWATIGGIVVFVGLLLEKFAEWMDDRFLGGAHKPHKTLESVGWCILMLGIFVEIAIAAWSANDAWQTRQMAIKNDPLNQPIKSLKADIVLIVKGRNFDVISPEDSKETTMLSLFRRWKPPETRADASLMRLFCSEFEKRDGALNNVPARFFLAKFEWPSANLDAWMHRGDFLERTNLSPSMLDKQLFIAEIWLPEIKEPNSEILGGSFVLTINGSLQRTFILPKYTWGIVTCPVATNGP